MAFKKVRYGKEEIFTSIVNDIDGRELEKWKVHKEDFPKVIKILFKKFSIPAKVIIKDKKDRDLEWALR